MGWSRGNLKIFKMKLEPLVERHDHGKVATPDEGTQVVLSAGEPGSIGMNTDRHPRNRIMWLKHHRIYSQPGKLRTCIPDIPINAEGAAIFAVLTQEAFSKSWVEQPEQLP
jgi:hypothetical protein